MMPNKEPIAYDWLEDPIFLDSIEEYVLIDGEWVLAEAGDIADYVTRRYDTYDTFQIQEYEQ